MLFSFSLQFYSDFRLNFRACLQPQHVRLIDQRYFHLPSPIRIPNRCCIYGQIMRCYAAVTSRSQIPAHWVPAGRICLHFVCQNRMNPGRGRGRVMLAVICCWSISVLAFMCATKSCSLTQMLSLSLSLSLSLAVFQPGCSPN